MTSQPRPLRFLYTGARDRARRKPRPAARAHQQVLEAHGHEIILSEGIGPALEAPGRFDGLIIDAGGEGGVRDLLLMEEAGRAGVRSPILLITGRPSLDLARRAIDLGVTEIISGPFAPGELVRAVQALASDAASVRSLRAGPPSADLCDEYPATVEGAKCALSDLLGHLGDAGVASPHRARVVLAAAELIDNVLRHAHPQPGAPRTFDVEVRLLHRRLRLIIGDHGIGLDLDLARLEVLPAALPSGRCAPTPSALTGLGRVSRLAESLDLAVDEKGTVAEASFELTPVACVDAPLPTASEFLERSYTACTREESAAALQLAAQRLGSPRLASPSVVEERG